MSGESRNDEITLKNGGDRRAGGGRGTEQIKGGEPLLGWETPGRWENIINPL